MIISRGEAKSLGLKFYYTGKPCRRGHEETPRYVTNYHCLACSKEDSRKESTKSYQALYRASSEGQYIRHRNHAGERGIEFRLTFEEWISIWEESGFYNSRGNDGNGYVMGRFRDEGAYEVGNVRIIPFSENIREAVNIRISEGRHVSYKRK